MAGTLPHHCPGNRPDTVKRACQVRSNDIVPVLFGHADSEAVMDYAGIVHQDIDLPPTLHDRFYHPVYFGPLTDIGLEGQGNASLFRYELSNSKSIVMPLTVIYDDPCSGTSETQCDRPSQAAGSPGNDNNAVILAGHGRNTPFLLIPRMSLRLVRYLLRNA